MAPNDRYKLQKNENTTDGRIHEETECYPPVHVSHLGGTRQEESPMGNAKRHKLRVGGCLLASVLLWGASVGVAITLDSATASASTSAGTVTFSSNQIGASGQTPQFTESGKWQMAWSYNCSNFGSSGNFGVTVNEPSSSTTYDQAPNELGTGGSGTDYYTNTGTFSLSVNSECNWTITVSPSNTTSPPPILSRAVGMADAPNGTGYWIARANGQVQTFGDAKNLGGIPAPSTPVAAIAAAPSGQGYFLVTQTGQVYAFGSAVYHGGANNLRLNAPIVAMAADPATGGYWLLGGDGGVFSFDAPFYGSTGNIHLNKPAVGMEATPHGNGYRFVASDGGVFDYGSAAFYGSMGGTTLNKPVVGMAIDPATGGYWLDAADGGIFSFNAPFHGSTGNIHLNKPCVGMVSTPHGNGYRFVAADGGIFDFGSAPFYGSGA